METNKNLLIAMQVIKDECIKHSNCEGCPLDAVGLCCPLDIPAMWDIPEVSENEEC